MNRKSFVKYLLAFGVFIPLFLLIWKNVFQSKRFDFERLGAMKRLMEELVDTIIPKTDTPGAKEANVASFIMDMLRDCSTKREQQSFYKGMLKLEEYSFYHYNRPFINCTAGERETVLEYFEQSTVFQHGFLRKMRNRFFGEPFICRLKNLTVEGYCTSFQGATLFLAYDFVPGEYQSCITLAPGQRAWALM